MIYDVQRSRVADCFLTSIVFLKKEATGSSLFFTGAKIQEKFLRQKSTQRQATVDTFGGIQEKCLGFVG